MATSFLIGYVFISFPTNGLLAEHVLILGDTVIHTTKSNISWHFEKDVLFKYAPSLLSLASRPARGL